MSLVSSIFGSSGGKSAASIDLFAKVSVPSSIPTKSSPSKKKKNDKKSKKEDKDDSSDSSSDSESSTKDQSTTQPTTKETTTKSINKPTKEQLKEESERTIFVGNLPVDITRKTLASIFKPCGTVLSTRLRSVAVSGVKLPPEQAGNQNMMRKVCANTGKLQTDTPKNNAQGYVVFESLSSIPAALQMNNTTYESHSIRVDHAIPTIEPTRSVFVGNLPYSADEETLQTHFINHLSVEDYNESEGCAVQGVRIIRDKETQKCKGFGYVMLRDATLVPLALGLHNQTTYMKKELRVMVCGKRFKGTRGRNDDDKSSGKGRRSFEGQRASGGGGASSTKKRKSNEGISSMGNVGKAKKRRARSDKKTTNFGANSGGGGKMSKRAATDKKVNKRVKKLEKRVRKGMGKKH